MNLPDPIVTFDETPSDIDVYAMTIPPRVTSAEDEPPADTSQLFPDKNDEFNSKVENTVVISSTEPQENEIIPDPSYLKWNVVKTDSEVHVEKLERRLKLLQEGKIKPKAPPVNKDPFRDEEIVDLDKLVPQAYEPTSEQDPLLDNEDEEQDNDWREEVVSVPKREDPVPKGVRKYDANEHTPILGRRDESQSCACCTIS
jgi:hypothetical protein